ncbi:Uncharacterized protein Rs2_40724 [Raphanus sativus]|nr:Uncharacterized protein Rs2_40724 [Raphanus sativus]
MVIEVDTRKPLVFTRKILSPGGDKVSIQIKYEILFKHCSSCGMLSHELSLCPREHGTRGQQEKRDVFSRAQPPICDAARQPLLRAQKSYERVSSHDQRESSHHRSGGLQSSQRISEDYQKSGYVGHTRKEDTSDWFVGHGGKDRYKPVMRRYGSRYAPYDKNGHKSWMPKDKAVSQREPVSTTAIRQQYATTETMNITREPYAQDKQFHIGPSSSLMENAAESAPPVSSGQKIASVIITPQDS